MAVVEFCRGKRQSCPKLLKKASVKLKKGVFGAAEHPPDHLLEVEGDEEYAEIHVDFGLAGVAEAPVLHVVFHLSENGLRFYWPAAAPEQPLLRGEQFAGVCLVAAQVVVDLHLAVSHALETGACSGHVSQLEAR